MEFIIQGSKIVREWKDRLEIFSRNNNNNLYFKRVTPITTKSILPSGPLKTKLITIKLQQS